jgi:hypothetical protein
MATAKTPAAIKAAPKAKVETYVEPEPEVLATIQPETKKFTKKKDEWVFKDRLYELASGKNRWLILSLQCTLQKARYFTLTKKKDTSEKYAMLLTKRSPFVDEQEGTVTLGRIVLRNVF